MSEGKGGEREIGVVDRKFVLQEPLVIGFPQVELSLHVKETSE
jgi:hypothetical protein